MKKEYSKSHSIDHTFDEWNLSKIEKGVKKDLVGAHQCSRDNAKFEEYKKILA